MLRARSVNRRQFLHLGLLTGGGLVLTACGAAPPSPTATRRPTSAPTAAPTAGPTAEAERVLVGDVLEYALTSNQWPGAFGFVRFRLHEALVGGQSAYFIRTDGSDPAFSQENGLVNVLLLNNAAGQRFVNSFYWFEGDRLPVITAAPDSENYTSLFQLKKVTVGDNSLELASAEAIEQAAADGGVTVEEQSIFVNYPVIKWPGGELASDDAKEEYLGGGQLIEPVNVDDMTVTFKLHQCFPGSRYIVTDTSAAPMAPMMAIPASPPNQAMLEAERAVTARIWVFANGIPGSGVMGFQPAVFDSRAGDPTWSPFWNHFTLRWLDESQARVLRSVQDVQAALEAGEVEQFNGTPDSHPNGFVVNCPVPVLAPNTFTG